MRLFQSKRTINSPLVCQFHSEVNPSWFTKANLDSIPVCTDCNVHLIPSSMKDVLVTGTIPPSLELDSATSLTAAFASVTMLWAYLNSVGTPILANAKVAWKVWNPENYPEWPNVEQSVFRATFREGKFLSSPELGSLTEQMDCLGSVCSNLVWQVETGSKQKTVTLWPKESLATISAENYEALLEYLAIAKVSISNQPVWKLLDVLIALVSKNPPRANSKSFFGADVVLHIIGIFDLQESSNLKKGDEFKSRKLLELEPESKIDPYGPDCPKRIFHKLSPEIEMIGPLDLNVKVVSANVFAGVLTLVHSYSFKMLVSAPDSEAAVAQIKQKFFEKFGLTLMMRENQNWLVNKNQGVDWENFRSMSVRESSLFSKIVDVKLSDKQAWKKTVWASQLR